MAFPFTSVTYWTTLFYLGGILLAADYSQLELRMIAHLSNDKKLIRILNNDGDVFKLITAEWKGVSPEEVTETERQQAKQVFSGKAISFLCPTLLGHSFSNDWISLYKNN